MQKDFLTGEEQKAVTFLSPIQSLLERVEERMRSQANGHYPDLDAALDHLLSSGGKRIRPAVALLTGRMLHGDAERLVTLAASIELLHTATLVHDDLIDGAFLRRGIATLNSQWSPAATVLTGDFIFAQAAKLASETQSVKVMQLFAGTLATIVNGELTQMFQSKMSASLDDYFERIYAKTASMFELATSAAAILSEVNAEIIEAMRYFGYAIGMAFQIVDDVLDFTGEQVTVGKPVASDLRQGIVTLPVIYYVQSHPSDVVSQSILSNRSMEQSHLEAFVERVRHSIAIEEAIQKAQHFVDEGLMKLQLVPASVERRALEELANYIIRRRL